MSVEENKAAARRNWEEVVNQGNFEVVDEVYAPSFTFRDPALMDREIDTPEKMKRTVAEFRQAFPDITYHIQDIVGEGDKVAIRWRQTSTYTNPLYPGSEPDGEKVDVTGIDWFRFENGKVVEEIAEWDLLKMLQQIGVVPPMGPPEPEGVSRPDPTPEGGAPAAPEANKAVVRRCFEEFVNWGKLEIADEVYAESFTFHNPSQPYDIHNREGMKRYVTALRTAFPDIDFAIEDMIAEGDRVVMLWTLTGTHTGTGLIPDLAPTGKRITATGIDYIRVVDGRIVEDWSEWGVLSMLQQLGLAPELGSGHAAARYDQDVGQ